jgi:hypothetical protein
VDGELQASDEPSEPEWGNLSAVMRRGPSLNKLGGEAGTAGTETSQYREERKSTRFGLAPNLETPGVVASETGRAQTDRSGGDTGLAGL